MVDFRKVFLVLVALTLLAGLASAQGSQTPFQCTAVGANPPALRGEGLTELVGDIIIQCSGGAPIAGQIPTANITVYMNSIVTSRLLGTASVSGASEALLLIDDPGNSTLGTYGSSVPQVICPNPLQGAGIGGCTEFVGSAGTMPTQFNLMSSTMNAGVPQATSATSGLPGANVFQGVVSGGSVTFYGVPILPPVTTNIGRTFRITNIRVNANTLNGGGLVPTNAVAAIQVTGTAALNLLQSAVTVGYVSQSMTASVYEAYSHSTTAFGALASTITLNQCQSYPATGSTPQAIETLRYQETGGQGSAFKPRGNTGQNVPGQNYFTESGLTVSPALTGSTQANGIAYTAGYADWGTRLKAVFNNVPSGVSLFVSVTNLNSSDNAPMYTAGVAATVSSSFAELITGEISPDSAGNPASPGGLPNPSALPLVSQTGTTTSSVIGSTDPAGTAVGFASIPVVNGSASAVWEVVNSLPNTPENFDFEVFITVTANVASNIPPAPSTMTVNMSYAPIPTQGAFTLASGQAASATLGIPRFVDTSTGATALKFQICQTALLFPYVIEVAGFDTGLAIANTSQDPFGTSPQTGSCSIYWYGQSGVPATNPGYLGSSGYQTVVPTSPIAAGTIQAWATSAVAPGFSGYVIAVCNFQYAHGFAFVSDLGSQKLAMGYLADVLNTPITTVPRGNAATSTSLPLPAGVEANGQ